MPIGVRIAFCEIRGEGSDPQFRSAVLISYLELPGVVGLLQRAMDSASLEVVSPDSQREEEAGG